MGSFRSITGSFLPKARSFSSTSQIGGSKTRRKVNRNANIHCNPRRLPPLCPDCAHISSDWTRRRSALFRPNNNLLHNDLCRKKLSFCSFSFCFPSSPQRHPSCASGNAAKRSPHPIINQTIAHDGQRTEEKLQKAVSGRARGVGERILPERENVDIQKTSEKFCDPQIYP